MFAAVRMASGKKVSILSIISLFHFIFLLDPAPLYKLPPLCCFDENALLGCCLHGNIGYCSFTVVCPCATCGPTTVKVSLGMRA